MGCWWLHGVTGVLGLMARPCKFKTSWALALFTLNFVEYVDLCQEAGSLLEQVPSNVMVFRLVVLDFLFIPLNTTF